MIKKIKRKFVYSSLLAVVLLLVVILSIVNIVNFSLVTNDADTVIERIMKEEERFIGGEPLPPATSMEPPMGPSSPDMPNSMRFVKITFDKNGNVVNGIYKISAVSNEDANLWAKSLLSSGKGWTRLTYRFQTIKEGNTKTVIIVDESRELLPSYRVLIASVVGVIVGSIVTLVLLIIFSNKFVKPIEESDKKQKKFISDAARELKNPLTIISLEEEVIKAAYGESESTKLIEKQLNKLNKLTKKMNELIILEDINVESNNISLSNIIEDEVDKQLNDFVKSNITVNKNIESNVEIFASEEIIRKMIAEIVTNGHKYARSYFNIDLRKEGSRITIEFSNDVTEIKDGTLDLVFERFYKENEESLGNGLGLSFVREVIRKYNGRISAKGLNNTFILKIEL